MAAEPLPIGLPREGVYQLLLHLSGPKRIRVGKLGSVGFAEGYYVYTGRAVIGLRARLERHLRKNKKMRWHIDYLLSHARVTAIRVFQPSRVSECEASKALQYGPACKPVPNFGSSDCNCKSHLTYLGLTDAAFYDKRGVLQPPSIIYTL